MSKIKKVKKAKLSQEIIQPVQVEYNQIEQVVQFEKRIYDLEQLLDIAQSFCQNLDFAAYFVIHNNVLLKNKKCATEVAHQKRKLLCCYTNK